MKIENNTGNWPFVGIDAVVAVVVVDHLEEAVANDSHKVHMAVALRNVHHL